MPSARCKEALSDKVIDAARQRIEIMQSVAKHHGATLEDLLVSIERGKDVITARSEPQIDADDLVRGLMDVGDSTMVSRPGSSTINLG